MFNVILDFLLMAVFIIGLTALVGVISSTIGLKWFGGGNQNHHLNHSMQTQVGWRQVGGKNNH